MGYEGAGLRDLEFLKLLFLQVASAQTRVALRRRLRRPTAAVTGTHIRVSKNQGF